MQLSPEGQTAPDPDAPLDRQPSRDAAPDEQPAPGAAYGGETPEWVRRRRRAAVFGDTLPDTTRDERGPGRSGSGEPADEAWLKAQVPPHHG